SVLVNLFHTIDSIHSLMRIIIIIIIKKSNPFRRLISVAFGEPAPLPLTVHGKGCWGWLIQTRGSIGMFYSGEVSRCS
ncbi:MAG: hypothetical protein ACPH3A_01780, partial [Luminiphilus sp.]